MSSVANWDAEYDRNASGPSIPRPGRSALEDEDQPMPDSRDFLGQFQPAVEPEAPETPLEQLTRHWMNERHAPDILPAQDVLLSSLLDHIRRQSETIQLLRGDPSTSEEEHIRIMLAQTEVERVKFIVRSYVRTRLFKIENYARYIIANEQVQTRITTAERDYASRHAHLIDRHFYSSVLQSLPESQAGLDDIPNFIMPPMVTEPDTTRAVFAHALKKILSPERQKAEAWTSPKAVLHCCHLPLLQTW
ncbi:DNA replication complex GINS protein SLD5 [Mycena sanguinolenta]|uniref:DNA replication complex GINS protein SLD5 n=1 Tax=Mycena sanguinolenta TaxID=230812 RepID=A0A8H6YHH6_9AGAR|nr:DNA replication complex GINS protein SLD5 [Mycena sanguinolenta]